MSIKTSTALLRCAFVMLLMVIGAPSAWAQTDYSGTYYIGSRGYNASKPADNYYLCPTEGWAFYVAINNVQAADNGQPFLTTFKCKNGTYDRSKAVWILKKHPTEENCYYIIQEKTGKYVISNGTLTGGDGRRARVHLETVSDPSSLNDMALFEITYDNDHYDIIPHSTDGRNGDSEIYFSVNNGNKDQLDGEKSKGGGPTGYTSTGGIIGMYSHSNDKNEYFYLEPAATIGRPDITNNYTATNTITITAATGATIYYTTDGTMPTTSSASGFNLSIDPTSDVQVIKAIAKSDGDDYPTPVTTYNLPVLERPVITVENNMVTITSIDGASIFYTTDNTEATTSSTPYSAPFSLGSATAVRAIATKAGYYRSSEAFSYPPLLVTSSSEIEDMTRSYILASGFTSTASIGTKGDPFKGTIDGNMETLSGLSHPLVAYAEGAIIKNVIVDNVSISSGNGDGNTGAICGEAKGDSRIYNCGVLASGSTVTTDKDGYTTITSCSSTISGSNYVGGIVGLLDGSSRVINCFSYADITGGSEVGGIVGHNNGATASNNLKTMVFACMFYGNISGGTSKAPIYNGIKIDNKNANGVGNFNYFLADAPWAQDQKNFNEPNKTNCALMAETRYLQRFEFFRHLLNSQRELAAWWATGNRNNKDEMKKWVLEPSQIGTSTPFPILRDPKDAEGKTIKYPSVVNIDAANAQTGQSRNMGSKLGTLTVKIQMGSGAVYGAPDGAVITTSQLTLNITDKDPAHFNFNYYKVQLPYYNDVGTKNYNGNRVVTGWKIVNIIGGTRGTFSTSTADAPSFNFADRHCTNKDLYDTSGRVFNQGAYWDVPEGVTEITIQPYWARCSFLADSYPDVVYNQIMETAYTVSNVGGGQIYTDGNNYNIAGQDQKVYTNSDNARNNLGLNASHTVYDHAIVLVGNFHKHNGVTSGNNKGHLYTIMSADFDHDNEPDYCYIQRYNGRTPTHPVRVDFINIPGLGMAQKSDGGTGSYNAGIMQPIGWFESTNTSLFRVTQFEYDRTDRAAAPYIVQGGVMEQWVSGQSNGVANTTTYFHVGGNVWFKEFHRGTHQDNSLQSKHPPVSVTGGDYDEFYLTGLYTANVISYQDNAECYINGGRFGTVAGAAMEGLDGNITWQVQNADINEFYAGGINDAEGNTVTGNLCTVLEGGYIKQFCGGPKFGDMSANKTVTTIATNCTFDTFFGAGYGGNSYSRQVPFNASSITNIDWNKWIKGQTKYGNDSQNPNFTGYKREYKAAYDGVSSQFDYQFLPMSDNKTNVARLWIEYVKFSLATTRNVTSTLTGCTITGKFYGGGNLGKVDGDVTSTLTDCTVNGDVFGAGYSASLPTVEMDDLEGFATDKEPYYYEKFGTYRVGIKGETTTYTWVHGNSPSVDNTNHILYTTEDLTSLGTVTGQVTLNIAGSTTVAGNVYGGGESSDVSGDKDGAITSHVEVNVEAGTMTDVYGGGKGKNTVVAGDVVVNIGAKDGSGTLSGNGAVSGNVYGGSALGAVNAKSTKGTDGNVTAYTPSEGKTTRVNIYKGSVTGSVFGGGKGDLASLGGIHADIVAQNFGNTTVNMEGGTVSTAVYGGADTNGVLKESSTLTITGGTVGTSGGDEVKNAIFGGGYGEPTQVYGDVTVNIGTKSDDETPIYTGNATIHGHVYGGGALGSTNGNGYGSTFTPDADKKTNVNLLKGTVNGNVFGGGLGRQAKGAVAADPEHGIEAQDAVEAVEAFVGGDVTVTLDGAKVPGSIFGCNNLNGTPKGHVKVHVMRTVNVDDEKNALKNNSTTARENRITYDVDAVYGGGNQADYNPTKATGTTEEKEDAFAEVLIEGCEKTSIDYVYGGGNAAAVPATKVTVKGSYIINTLYGGGNGAGYMDPPTNAIPNPGANVGIIDPTAYAANHENGTYGTGKAETKLMGGYINNVYGGSNTKGDVRGGTDVRTKEKSDPAPDGIVCCSTLNVGDIYGAGSHADVNSDVNIILECMPEDYVDAVFGGAEEATVTGDVTLVVTSGKFGRVFGGNNKGGDIRGSIKVWVKENGCKPLEIGELYGGGNKAPYSKYGCEEDGGNWIPNTSETVGAVDYTKGAAHAIEVIVESCTSIGKVFGGGNEAEVIGNTHVYINMFRGTTEDTPLNEFRDLGKIGQVFGGGNLAKVTGNTTVDIGTDGEYVDSETETVPEGQKKGVKIESGTYIHPTENTTTSITSGIYGGGNQADVDGNTILNIGTANQSLGINITGNIFGGGYGESTHVTGDVVVNIGKKTETIVNEVATYTYEGYANITGDVYGGSAKGKVNSHLVESVETASVGKTTKVYVYGGTISGNLYGGGLGDLATLGVGHADAAAHVFGPVTLTMCGGSANNVFGCNNVNGAPQSTVVVTMDGGNITQNVYGGGNQAAYTVPGGSEGYPVVNINHGTVTGNVFGGGYGASATVMGNPQVTIGDTNDSHTAAVSGSVYGGGDEGNVHGNPHVYVQNTHTKIAQNVFGGGKGRSDTFTCAEAMVGEELPGNACVEPDADGYKDKGTKVTISNGTIGTLDNGSLVENTGNVYGGGEIGRVEWNTQVEIGVGTGDGPFAPVIEGNVFGAGKGLVTHGYSALVRGNSSVIIGGSAKIGKNVYGGGEIATVGRYWVKDIPADLCGGETRPDAPTDLPTGMPYLMRRGGKSSVTIQDKADIGYRGVANDAGHVFGAGRGVEPDFVPSGGENPSKKMMNNNRLVVFEADDVRHKSAEEMYLEFLETLALVSQSSVTINGSIIKGNIYGGSESGFVQTTTSVEIKGASIIGTSGMTTYGHVFGGGKGLETFAEAGKVRGSTTVSISDGIIYGNVYGGGQLGYVKQGVTVNVSGGKVVNDVYGGGALADTNTENWVYGADESVYIDITSVMTTGTTSVTGLYEKTGETTYVETADDKAVENKHYYEKRLLPGHWAAGKNSASNTTKVTLTGGIIGNVYGGGLGSNTKPVYVFGDVQVIINKPEDISRLGGLGAAFTQNSEDVTIGGKPYTGVPLTGRVFGCNNVSGTPLGNVLVEVYSTRNIDDKGNRQSGHRSYEMQAVYGGGNQADYVPDAGKNTVVNIYGCDECSIARVYGGGNSAIVPETNVTIWGSYDIEYAFGGGNGGQPVKTSSGWVVNEGASVTGHAQITCHGGKIGELFGGSDFKGDCRKATATQAPEGSCPLKITKAYGAGKEANIDGDVNIVFSGCTAENSQFEYVCGGSYKASISGSVHLTITAGYFKNVYGGNDQRGGIGGNIIVDIEETDPCKPIIIGNLVGGGNQAVFPGTDKDGNAIVATSPARTITVNVKSATRIDNVYGGSFKAETTANTEVNINMLQGRHKGTTVVLPEDYGSMNTDEIPSNINSSTVTIGYVDATSEIKENMSVVGYYTRSGEYPNYVYTPATGIKDPEVTYWAKQVSGTIATAIGTIGNVFGGGKEGLVTGNTVVNIGTETTVPIMKRIDGEIVDTSNVPIFDEAGRQKPGVTIAYENQPVLGAHIEGDVFGGGEEAAVTGSTEVNICTEDYSSTTGFEGVSIGGSVYGGGSSADVLENTKVTMSGGYVFDGVYGGGLHGSVGTVETRAALPTDHPSHEGCLGGKPETFADGTGKCTVVVNGGQVGPVEAAKSDGGMLNTAGYFKEEGEEGPVDVGFVFGAGRGDVENPDENPDADYHTYVYETDVTIDGNAIIMASVYGGGENGRVRGNTKVTISGGQIGCGEGKTQTVNGVLKPLPYTTTQWTNEDPSDFTECAHYDYGKDTDSDGKKDSFLPFDPYYDAFKATLPDDYKYASTSSPSDGKTYYGCVFGGGSGYFPYEIHDIRGNVTGYEWLRSAGLVEGNTVVNITGGHILTCVYGGNEYTDVLGTCTVTMSGGTLGVPRADTDAQAHPVSCYLFGAGKGDPRTHFNTWTNVQKTIVEVSGTARIFGSVFGGGEDGHVLGDSKVTISGGTIGTKGTSYVDGNVFGGGRGYSGEALTAGSIGGNVLLNISGGTMLGSIYGGGRLASVGTYFVDPASDYYGQLQEDDGTDNLATADVDESKNHGHITVNISGGTIGNTTLSGSESGAHYSGNVYGGSMGRLTLLDGSINPLWPELAQAKTTAVNITGNSTHIYRNVYGGGEFGSVRENTYVTIGGTLVGSTPTADSPSTTPTIHGSVYGGGYGSDKTDPTLVTVHWNDNDLDYVYTPMQWAGLVGGNTTVSIFAGSTVNKNVYGGGELASVGVIDYQVDTNTSGTPSGVDGKYYKTIKKHASQDDDEKTFYDFGLSWPYEFTYVPCKPGTTDVGGLATVNVAGGTVTQYVYGGGQGQVAFGKKVYASEQRYDDITEQRYTEAFCANVRETQVTIGTNEGGPTISQSVYGGAENGHVYENTNVTINKGTVSHSVFGGGKGDGIYKTTLWKATGTDAAPDHENLTNQDAYSWTSGRVYGNSTVTMHGGTVNWFIYGGGNLGSVGKGNYTGGSDDYSTGGYGELPSADGTIWTATPVAGSYAHYFQNSGISTVNLYGGTVGSATAGDDSANNGNGIPYGSVFGGSRGKAAASCKRSPRYRYVPDFFLGYTNKAIVNIGGTSSDDVDATGPTIYGSVYGGGQDGHVRNSSEVHIYKGSISAQDAAIDRAGRSGNVFGAGSGIGTFDTGKKDDSNQPIMAVNNSSGSVTCTTLVEVNGGSIARNVYGGGAMASVGPPKTGPGPDEQKAASDDHASYSYTRVDIKGGRVDGSVYAASRGPGDAYLATNPVFDTTDGNYDASKYATDIWSYLYVTGGTILDNAYGGGEGGIVKHDTEVHLTGGTITNDAYGGGKGTMNVPANVLGNTTLELNKGVATNKPGCVVKKVFGANDFRGSPKGHVKVHVFATQNSGKADISHKIAPPDYTATKGADEGYKAYLTRLISEATVSGGLAADATVITNAKAVRDGLPTTDESTWNDATKKLVTDAAKTIIDALNAMYDYDVQAVYGGGDLAIYDPTDPDEKTEVIIEGCDVTSIQQVYGGGNAAPVSGTNVLVKSCFIIDEVFGGGNGKDKYQIGTTWYENPGANVGYRQMSHYVESDKVGYNSASHGTGDETTPYKAIENDGSTVDYPDAREPEVRRANYEYGSGEALTTINGGHIHTVYGCSNEKGNIRAEARSRYQQVGTCTMIMDNTYGGSKTSDNDAEIVVEMDCVKNGGTYYGGSYQANIYSDVNIHITNGTYDKIFGGNDRAGTINGKITITVEENGCSPIRINSLYAGGKLAPYSVYGYKTETENALDENGNSYVNDKGEVVKQRIPYKSGESGALSTPYWDPRINIISATRIDNIYGGGYGATATLIGNPHVNVNMMDGRINASYAGDYSSIYDLATDGSGDRIIPRGSIGTIYGGGELADVVGDTHVEIGTGQYIASWDASGNPVWKATMTNDGDYTYTVTTPAVNYTRADCNEHNATLTGYIASTTTLTAEQATAVNRKLGTSYDAADAEKNIISTEDAAAYNATLTGYRTTDDVKTAAVYYTAGDAEVSAGTKLVGEIKTAAVYYTQDECNTYNAANVSGYIASGKTLTAEQAAAVNATLGLGTKTQYVYAESSTIYTEDAALFNATLDGFITTAMVKTPAEYEWRDAGGEAATPASTSVRNDATITGNVFGGGKGKDDTFECEKAMVGIVDKDFGSTSVIIGNGIVGTFDQSGNLTAGGNVYGGGEIARVEKNTSVTIGLPGNTTNTPTIGGTVFGAGQGVYTHGYSGLVRGNSTVTIQGKAKIGHNVYGGGEEATVGRYIVVDSRPTTPRSGGKCTVTIGDYAEIGPDNMKMTATGGPDDYGHVFGAGKGVTPYEDVDGTPWSSTFGGGTATYTTDEAYLSYLETLALASKTEVTIGGHAFVKGSVYGGSENGRVQTDTWVKIREDCQIGNGFVQANDDGTHIATSSMRGVNRRYTDAEWTAGHLFVDSDPDYTTGTDGDLETLVKTTTKTYTSSLPECAHWPYGYEGKYAPYDKFAKATGTEAELEQYEGGTTSTEGGRRMGSDGHTFYGNVFGGGSGYYPYKAGKWHENAGAVGGNTKVDITGGHILTNIYGGNEMTNVVGNTEVNFGGSATLGVPRTLGQIAAHPVTCYLFGAGKGDQRVFFNKQTNVQDVTVNVTGGWVYGSVFGGGEDGHVMRNVNMTISNDTSEPEHTNTKIGTWGTSYVDGNVFGGGRGFAGDAYTAGNVAGSVTMNITGGEMLGSIYGGGRLGSVGYGLYDALTDGDPTPGYGEMRDDDKMDDDTDGSSFFTKGRGRVEVNISGGTIGNTYEYQYIDPEVTGDDLATKKANMPSTQLESNNRLKHTRGGNVYAGGMGRYTQLDGSTPISAVDWLKLGNVKSTTLNISGDVWIMGNVYGGGEMGTVRPYEDKTDSENPIVQGGTTTISITGGTIGTEITATDPVKTTITDAGVVKYTFGSVYGGGMGMEDHDASDNHGGEVKGNTTVSMSGTSSKVRASVYGGGEMAIVDGNTNVTISGGEIGRGEVKPADDADAGYVMFGGATMGNVYGGGKGSVGHVNAGQVKGNTNITINAGDEGQPFIYHNIYGGGALASVGTFRRAHVDLAGETDTDPSYIPSGEPYGWTANTGTATVTIKGGTIGISGRDNGMVNGSSRGDISDPNVYYTQAEIDAATSGDPAYGKTTNDIKSTGIDPYDKVAWVNNTIVTIGTDDDTKTYASPLITGNVYGGGENGHNRADSRVNIYDGTIGVVSGDWATFATDAKTREVNNSRGAVYGAGCGQDTYTITVGTGESAKKYEYYNPKAGSVFGNSYVTVKGGLIARNVYGGGSIASVGTITNATDTIEGGSAKHTSETTSFALSWPYKFEYLTGTGVATINIEGGHIGMGSDRIVGLDNGNIYGGSKGDAGNRYTMAHIANVKESHVNVDFTPASTVSSEMLGSSNYAKACIEGSVFGGGENGHVIGDTYVTMKNGFVSHSMFGGGRGEGKYTGKLIKVTTGPGVAGPPKAAEYTREKQIFDWLSGKVYGNTHLTIAKGRVLNNVLGGGYMASVGKGNYASGSDDYYSTGYGETLAGSLWEHSVNFDPDVDVSPSNIPITDADYFLSSGKTYVNVFGGEIGSTALWDGLPAGSIFGGCRGMAAPNLRESQRYKYNPEWLNGYTNETHVTIGGGYVCKAVCTDKNSKAHAEGEMMSLQELQKLFKGLTSIVAADGTPSDTYWTPIDASTLKIYGSVYGGAQDGRIRRDANVTVNAGEIGLPFTDANRTLLVPNAANLQEELESAQWLHRGNVYGAGSGISMYKFDANDDDDTADKDLTYYEGTLDEEGYSQYAGCVIRYTNVDINGGIIHRNVYGGGSMGSVGPPAIPPSREDVAYKKGDTTHGVGWQSQNTVNIAGTVGTPYNTEKGWTYNQNYGGEVYGACRGVSTLDQEQYATSVWTKVNVFNGATIMGNVYGGGDAGMVKKDSEVVIGATTTP